MPDILLYRSMIIVHSETSSSVVAQVLCGNEECQHPSSLLDVACDDQLRSHGSSSQLTDIHVCDDTVLLADT